MIDYPATTKTTANTPVSDLPGMTTARVSQLARLKVYTVSDLLRHLPTRYEKQWAQGAIIDLPMDAVSATRGTIVATRWVGGRSRRPGSRAAGRFEATLEDHSGRLMLTWFNAPYLQRKLHPGMVIRVQGKTQAYRSHPQMVNPTWQAIDSEADTDDDLNQDRLVPVYPATTQLPSTQIQKLIESILPAVLPTLGDPLPAPFVKTHAMPPLSEAFRMAHQPAYIEESHAARRRLAFNELLLLQLGIALKRQYTQTHLIAPALRWSPAIDQHIRERFPFELTASQQRVIHEITSDLRRARPMNRLLQGDVGAGKTVVALYAMLLAAADNKQAALMAPTELLADQHFLSISNMLQGSNIRLTLLSGGHSTAGSLPRRVTLSQIASGQVDIVIGTQALLSRAVKFKDLAVVVIDEQHRFGVMQRAAFRSPTQEAEPESESSDDPALIPNADADDTGSENDQPTKQEAPSSNCPHVLVMTATPIPRSLSLTVFGDLDLSIIDKLPPGRSPIRTRVVGTDKADDVYTYIAGRVEKGEQCYVVVPTIDASEDQDQRTRDETAKQLKNVRTHMKLLGDQYFKGQRIAAVHGQLKRNTREAIMARFRNGDIRVLVATTVIEVGVDVPNATLMVIEDADRFGLAQLHQLRGRIGRGTEGPVSLCVLIADPPSDEAAARLKAIATTTDGFKIAEHDLSIRGMGQFFGTKQHGTLPLRAASLPHDMNLLQLARRDAQAMVDADPQLTDPDHVLLRKVLLQQYGDALGLIDVG